MAHLEGLDVIVTGLVKRPDLNGQSVDVEKWHADKGRYACRLSDSEKILLKPESLLFHPEQDGNEVRIARVHGEFLESLGRYEAAAASYQIMLPFALKHGGDAASSTLGNIGLALKRAFRWHDALTAYNESLQHCATQVRRDDTHALMAKMLTQLAGYDDDSTAGWPPQDAKILAHADELYHDIMRDMFRPHVIPYFEENDLDINDLPNQSEVRIKLGLDTVTAKAKATEQRDFAAFVCRKSALPKLDAVWVHSNVDGEGIRRLSRKEIDAIPQEAAIYKACLTNEDYSSGEQPWTAHVLKELASESSAQDFARSLKSLMAMKLSTDDGDDRST